MSVAPLRRVAIIGGGVSGALTAVHLAHLDPGTTRIVLFERSAREGRGLAYNTSEPGHLLNVRASNMSAFPDRPQHFESWLAAQDGLAGVEQTDAGAFVPRAIYGRYLSEVLRQVCLEDGTGCIGIRHAKIEAIRRAGEGFTVEGPEAATERFDAVVLAMGNVNAEQDTSGHIVRNPWSDGVVRDLDPDRPVLIQGTGLTMIDIVIALRRHGFRGKVIALSRHGLLPLVHAPAKPGPAPALASDEIASLSKLMRRLRNDAKLAMTLGMCWRAAVDALRPITQDLWRRLPLKERQRFLRHARPFWDVHRHRIAQPVADVLDRELDSGQLTIMTGRIVGHDVTGDGVAVTYQPRGTRETHLIDAQRLITATGVPNLGHTHDTLVAGLIEDGLARLDPLGLGLDVDDRFAVRGGSGQPIAGLWALGPLVRGVFWECTAVPDIRQQAQRLARTIADGQRTTFQSDTTVLDLEPA